jgi:carotene biosynthesis associated membrane protein
MRLVRILFIAHVAALTFGLAGLLIAMPHPELWADYAWARAMYTFGVQYAGSSHILFGAATMLAFGYFFVGARKTLIFFLASTLISVSSELLGTGTGFPFGAYSYTNFLGAKILGRVPFSIPLSWFYMGFTSFILASVLIQRTKIRHQSVASVLLGAYFLTVWDLALDPAMAAKNLLVHFWIWHQTGPYFGMPLVNLAGWTATGLIFMSVSRLLWREDLQTRGLPVGVPFGMYAANTIFAIALNLGAGLWIPPIMAVFFGLLPAALVLRRNPEGGVRALAEDVAFGVLRNGSKVISARNLSVSLEGLEHIPSSGPVAIVARHYHHLYDGVILLSRLKRRVHILVGLDWIRSALTRRAMETLCWMARWPVILREDGDWEGSAYAAREAPRYLRRAAKETVGLLRSGHVVVIFPEGYPNIDPSASRKSGDNAFLPFRPGFVKMVELAEKVGRASVPIVPLGLRYAREGRRWRVTARFGEPITARQVGDEALLAQMLERQVRALSAAPLASVAQRSVEPAPATQM